MITTGPSATSGEHLAAGLRTGLLPQLFALEPAETLEEMLEVGVGMIGTGAVVACAW